MIKQRQILQQLSSHKNHHMSPNDQFNPTSNPTALYKQNSQRTYVTKSIDHAVNVFIHIYNNSNRNKCPTIPNNTSSKAPTPSPPSPPNKPTHSRTCPIPIQIQIPTQINKYNINLTLNNITHKNNQSIIMSILNLICNHPLNINVQKLFSIPIKTVHK